MFLMKIPWTCGWDKVLGLGVGSTSLLLKQGREQDAVLYLGLFNYKGEEIRLHPSVPPHSKGSLADLLTLGHEAEF